MDGGAPPRPASPELLRCRRRRRPGAEGAGGGAEEAVARRNERERNRVRLVNLGFQALRERVPRGGARRRLSKAETLRSATAYIAALQRLLAEHDAAAPPGASRGPGCAGSSEPGSPRSSSSCDDSGGEGAPSPEGRPLLDASRWWGGC